MYVDRVSESNVAVYNGEEVSNFRFTTTKSGLPANSSIYSEINYTRQKIMDFFHYAVVNGEDVPATIGDCQEICGKGIFKQKCCAEVNMFRQFNS